MPRAWFDLRCRVSCQLCLGERRGGWGWIEGLGGWGGVEDEEGEGGGGGGRGRGGNVWGVLCGGSKGDECDGDGGRAGGVESGGGDGGGKGGGGGGGGVGEMVNN